MGISLKMMISGKLLDLLEHNNSENIALTINPSPLLDLGNSSGDTKNYSWLDLPCQGQGLVIQHSLDSSSLSFDSFNDIADKGYKHREDQVDELERSSSSLANTTTSHCKIPSSPRSSIQHDLDRPLNECTTCPKSSMKQRSVSFAPILCVRTYDVILGDHPCCVGGMALQCSWIRCGPDEIIDMEVAEQYSSKRRMGQLQLSYAQRKNRLQVTTGMTSCQLLKEEFKIRTTQTPLMIVRSNVSRK